MRIPARLAFTVLVLGFVTACVQPHATFTVGVAPSSLDLLRGDSADVTVTVPAGTEPAALSISGLPAGVTAAFAPPSVAAGGTASTLTLSAAADAVEDTYDVTVTATRGGAQATADLTVTVTSLTVEGRVVGIFGVPLADLEVRIGTSTATSGADGTFTIDGVAVPYDATVYSTSGDGFAHVFRGLTTTSPELLPYHQGIEPTIREAVVEGTLPDPVPADTVLRVCSEGLDGLAVGCSEVASGATDYGVEVMWFDGGGRAVRLHFLLVEEGVDGLTFPAATTADTTVTDGAVVVLDLASFGSAPASETISVSVSAADGSTIDGAYVSTVLGGGSSLPIAFPPVVEGTFTTDVPVIGAQTYDVVTAAESAGGEPSFAWRAGVEAGADVELVVPAPPALATPTDGADDVTEQTVFTTTGGTGVRTFLFGSEIGTMYAVTTMESSTTLPDLADLGLPLPEATSFTWLVLTHGGSATVDDATAAWLNTYYRVLVGVDRGMGMDDDGSFTLSGTRGFTTAP